MENEQPCKKVIKYPDIVTKECVIKNDTEDSDDKHYDGDVDKENGDTWTDGMTRSF